MSRHDVGPQPAVDARGFVARARHRQQPPSPRQNRTRQTSSAAQPSLWNRALGRNTPGFHINPLASTPGLMYILRACQARRRAGVPELSCAAPCATTLRFAGNLAYQAHSRGKAGSPAASHDAFPRIGLWANVNERTPAKPAFAAMTF